MLDFQQLLNYLLFLERLNSGYASQGTKESRDIVIGYVILYELFIDYLFLDDSSSEEETVQKQVAAAKVKAAKKVAKKAPKKEESSSSDSSSEEEVSSKLFCWP